MKLYSLCKLATAGTLALVVCLTQASTLPVDKTPEIPHGSQSTVQVESAPSPGMQNTFSAMLSDAKEVPSVKTKASGEIKVEVVNGGKQLHFTITVDKLKKVSEAHLHIAPIGHNGEVVAWLYPLKPPAKLIKGTTNGKLAEGTISAADLIGPA